MRTPLTHPKRLPMIAPSILSADFANMAAECRGILPMSAGGDVGLVSPGGADLLHLDVMDGHFVPNLTMGPDMCKALRRAFPDVLLDVHLMVDDPEPHAMAFAEAGADHVTFHAEVFRDRQADGLELARRVRQRGLTVGVAINPPTPAEVAEPYLEDVDLVLVMSVNPGFSGQSFIAAVLEKTEHLADLLMPTQRLEMDGGIKPENAGSVLDAGCDVVVAASAVFGVPASDRPGVIAALRGGGPKG